MHKPTGQVYLIFGSGALTFRFVRSFKDERWKYFVQRVVRRRRAEMEDAIAFRNGMWPPFDDRYQLELGSSNQINENVECGMIAGVDRIKRLAGEFRGIRTNETGRAAVYFEKFANILVLCLLRVEFAQLFVLAVGDLDRHVQRYCADDDRD
jgi:hypothetical protein